MIAAIITIARRWWPWIAVVALVTAVGWLIRDYGQAQYKAGQAQVQATWDAAKEKQAHIAASAVAADTTAGQQASNSYQGVISNEKERIRVVRETVVRTVTGPCLSDDGVRLANQAISGVPASSAAR